MGINTDIVFDYFGRLKLATVIVGLIDLLLTVSSYLETDARDQAFLSVVAICFIFSLVLVLGILFEYVIVSDFYVRLEMIFHSAACLLLLGSDTFFLISILKHGKAESFAARIFAMILGYVNAAIYGYLPWTLLKTS